MAVIYNNVTICTTEHSKCVGKIMKSRLRQTIEDICLLECSELKYTTSTSFAPLNENAPSILGTKLSIIDCTVLSIFSPTKSLRGREKKVQMSFTDFICKLFPFLIFSEGKRLSLIFCCFWISANIGGILGNWDLCLGTIRTAVIKFCKTFFQRSLSRIQYDIACGIDLFHLYPTILYFEEAEKASSQTIYKNTQNT